MATERRQMPIQAEIDQNDKRLIALYAPSARAPFAVIQPALARSLSEDLANLAELAEQ